MSHVVAAGSTGNADSLSFADLLDQYLPDAPRQFEIVEGTVTGVDNRGYRVDTYNKSESFVPFHEAGPAGELNVGDTKSFVVIGRASQFGKPGEYDETSMALSYAKIRANEKLTEAKAKLVLCKAFVIGVNRGNKGGVKRDAGLDIRVIEPAELAGMEGFIPGEEFARNMGRYRDFVHKEIPCVVEATAKSFGPRWKPVFSHAKAIPELTKQFLQNLRPGTALPCEVIRHSVRPNKETGVDEVIGAVVRLENPNYVTGFVPVKLASYPGTLPIESILPVGKKVKAVVQSVDLNLNSLRLQTKKATIDWDAVKACTGEVEGTVVYIAELPDRKGGKYQSQLIVQLDNGLPAEVWHSDVSAFRSRVAIGKRCPVNTRVKGEVHGFDESNGRLKLKLKPMTGPIVSRLEESMTGTPKAIEGKVMQVTQYGCYVGFDNADGVFLADGLLHSARYKKDAEGKIEDLKEGDKVKVFVESIVGGPEPSLTVTRRGVEG